MPAKLTAEGKNLLLPSSASGLRGESRHFKEGVGINLGLSNFQISFQDSDIYTLLRFFNLQYALEMRKSVP